MLVAMRYELVNAGIDVYCVRERAVLQNARSSGDLLAGEGVEDAFDRDTEDLGNSHEVGRSLLDRKSVV